MFAAALLAALLAVPPLAGSEPLPSLWTIITGNATTQTRVSNNGDDNSRDSPPGTAFGRSSSEGGQTQRNADDRSRSQSFTIFHAR